MCPLPGLILWQQSSGKTRPVGCRLLRCDACLGGLAWRRGLALADARPERLVTLTLVGDTWQTVRGRMRRLVYDLRATGLTIDWCWTVEPNPRGTGHHVHAWQRGSFVPQRQLSRMADRRGMGSRCDLRRWHQGHADGAGYALKGITYGVKGAAEGGTAAAFLSANGGRLTHQTRAWWGAGGVRDREREAVARRRAPGEGPWEVWEDEGARRHAARTGLALHVLP